MSVSDISMGAPRQAAAHEVPFYSIESVIVVHCNCRRAKPNVLVVRAPAQPVVCQLCKARYVLAFIHYDLKAWYDEQVESGADPSTINIAQCPMTINITRQEPLIMSPGGTV